MSRNTEKLHAHDLIERLPDSKIGTAIRFLEFILLDPIARAVAMAPADDEPATEQDRSRFLSGQARFAQQDGKGIPMNEVLAEFGLKLEDLHLSPEDLR